MEHQNRELSAEQEFMSFDEFKHAMDEWAIADGFTFFYQNLIRVEGLTNLGFNTNTYSMSVQFGIKREDVLG